MTTISNLELTIYNLLKAMEMVTLDKFTQMFYSIIGKQQVLEGFQILYKSNKVFKMI